MPKNLILLLGGAVLVVAGAGYLLSGGDRPGSSSACASLCANAEGACPGTVDEERCLAACGGFSAETRAHLAGVGDCGELMAKPELASGVIAESGDPSGAGEAEEASAECVAACDHYVLTCLTLVPDANEVLFEKGYISCLGQCADWDAAKTACMIGAASCEAMTEQCGL